MLIVCTHYILLPWLLTIMISTYNPALFKHEYLGMQAVELRVNPYITVYWYQCFYLAKCSNCFWKEKWYLIPTLYNLLGLVTMVIWQTYWYHPFSIPYHITSTVTLDGCLNKINPQNNFLRQKQQFGYMFT